MEGAMSVEMESLHKNSVWELVRKSKDWKVISSKWVFWKKESINEKEAPTYKAKLVAKEFSQKEGVYYDEIFSPMVKHTSIRVLLSLVAQLNMELEQLDVKTTSSRRFGGNNHMAQPEGFIKVGKEDLMCWLRKFLYGFKQSPRQWYKRFDTFMLQIG